MSSFQCLAFVCQIKKLQAMNRRFQRMRNELENADLSVHQVKQLSTSSSSSFYGSFIDLNIWRHGSEEYQLDFCLRNSSLRILYIWDSYHVNLKTRILFVILTRRNFILIWKALQKLFPWRLRLATFKWRKESFILIKISFH